MSDSMKLQAAVEMSVEQPVKAFDQIAVAADKMAGKVDKAAAKAGGSVDGMGAGASGSADQMTRAEGRMVASIKRVQTQLDLAGKTASQKFEFNIAAKGLDAAKFEPYLAQLRATEAAQARVATGAAEAAGKMAGLAAVAAGGAFAMWVKGAIDAADSLNDLSKSTSIAVETLSGLKMASRQSGAELEGTAQAINKLSVNMGANAAKFAAIGVTAKEPLEAFKQLADVFSKIDDPQLKAALGAEALGKSWAAAAPLLAEGGQSIQDMVDKGAKLSGVTQKLADDADAFNDVMEEWKTGIAGVASGIASGLLPVMLAMSENMSAVTGKADGMNSSFSPVTETLRAVAVLGGNVAFVLRGVGAEFGGMAAQVAAAARGDFAGAKAIGVMMTADAVAARAAFDKWESGVLSAGAAVAKAKKEVVALTDAQKAAVQSFADSGSGDKSSKNDWSQKYSAALAAEKEYSAAQIKIINSRVAAGVDSEEDGIKQVLAAQVTGYTKEYALLTEQIAKTKDIGDKAKLGQQLAGLGSGMQVAAAEYQAALAKIENARDKYMQSQVVGADNAAYKIEQENAALHAQVDILGMSDVQIGAYEAAKVRAAAAAEYLDAANLREAASTMEAAGIVSEAIPYYRQLADAREAAGKALDARGLLETEKGMKKAAVDAANEWKKTADKIGDSITDALMRGFESSKTLAENLRDTLYNMFRTLVLRPVIQATVISGMSAVGLGGSSNAMAGDSSSLSDMLTGGKSYAGVGSNLYSDFATSSVGQSAGLGTAPAYYASGDQMIGSGLTQMGSTVGSYIPLVGAGLSAYGIAGKIGGVGGMAAGTLAGAGTIALGGAASGAMAGTGALAGASTALAAVPVAGWIALAAIAAYSAFSGTKGGPKTEGNYFGVLDGSGASTAQQYSTGGNHGTGYSGDSADGQLAQMAPSITTAITGLIKSLGGSSAGVGINYGFNTDPAGTSEDQVSASVSDAAGNLVYGNHYSVEAGKYADALSLEAQRMTLASIKAAEGIEPIFKEVIAGIDLTSASADAMNQAISDMQGIVGLRTAFDNLNFGADALSLTIIKAAGGVSALGTSLDGYYGNYFTEAERTAKQADAVAKAFADMGIALPSSKEAFRALTEQVISTGDAGAETFAKLMSLQGAFATVADAAKSAADAQAAAAKSAADAIKSEFLSMYQTLTDALGSAASNGDPTIGSRNYALGALDYTVASVQSGQSLLGFSGLIESAISELSKSSEALYSTFEEYALSQARAAASITYLQGNAYANSHASGLERVPYDGYQMTAHAGEAVVDAASVQAISRYFGSAPSVGNTARLESLVEALTQEVINLRAEAKATAGHTNRTANALSRVMPDGDALQTRVTA